MTGKSILNIAKEDTRIGPQGRFPYPNNGYAAFGEVSILRRIELHSASLSRAWFGKLVWIAVPVIAVELHNEVGGREESIDAKLLVQDVLLQIGNAACVEKCITKGFEFVYFLLSLIGIGLAKHRSVIGAFVLALPRAILLVRPHHGRRGTLHDRTADFAVVGDLVSPLPLVGVVATAEIAIKAESIQRDIHALVAYATRRDLPGLRVRRDYAAKIAFAAAIPCRRFHSAGDGIAATSTGYRSDLSAVDGFHSRSIAQPAVCEKPLAMMEHIITASSKPGALVLDCFAGSGVVGEAARNCGRRAILCELNLRWVQKISHAIAQRNLWETIAFV